MPGANDLWVFVFAWQFVCVREREEVRVRESAHLGGLLERVCTSWWVVWESVYILVGCLFTYQTPLCALVWLLLILKATCTQWVRSISNIRIRFESGPSEFFWIRHALNELTCQCVFKQYCGTQPPKRKVSQADWNFRERGHKFPIPAE